MINDVIPFGPGKKAEILFFHILLASKRYIAKGYFQLVEFIVNFLSNRTQNGTNLIMIKRVKNRFKPLQSQLKELQNSQVSKI